MIEGHLQWLPWSQAHLADHIVEDASMLVIGELHICVNSTLHLHTHSTVRLWIGGNGLSLTL